MRPYSILPTSSLSTCTGAEQRGRFHLPSMSSFTAWDSTPSDINTVLVSEDVLGLLASGCLREPFWINGMTSSLGASGGFTLMWGQREKVRKVQVLESGDIYTQPKDHVPQVIFPQVLPFLFETVISLCSPVWSYKLCPLGATF